MQSPIDKSANESCLGNWHDHADLVIQKGTPVVRILGIFLVGDKGSKHVEWDQPSVKGRGENSVTGLRSRRAVDRGAREMIDAIDRMQSGNDRLCIWS